MAVRVRKLARELDGTTGEILGLLHELGLGRYRSPEDMLPGAAVEKVRRAWKRGVRAAPVAVEDAPRPAPQRGPRQEDLMSQLVPGVVPQAKAAPRARPKAPPIDAPLEQAVEEARRGEREALAGLRREADAARVALEADAQALEAARAALGTDREALEEAREAFSRERAALEADRQALEEARAALEHERNALDQARQAREGVPLVQVLSDRGLRGADEFERALAGLAQHRQLRELLQWLSVTDPDQAATLLSRTLVLVGGEIPAALPSGLTGIQVAPERAEIPGWEALGRGLTKVGELLMLHGLRRVVVVGGRPGWQRLLREGVDDRVEIRFLPPARRTPEEAESDVARADAVILWGTGLEPAAGHPYADPRLRLVSVPGDELSSLIDAISESLGD